MIGINVVQNDPSQFLSQIMPTLISRRAAGNEMLKVYKDGTIPIAFAGHALGLDPIEAWQAIRQGSTPIDVCLGDVAERLAASTLLDTLPLLILDPLTFWIAGMLDVLQALSDTFGPLVDRT